MDEAKVIAAGVLGVLLCVSVLAIASRACAVADKATFGKMDQRVDTENYYQSQAFRDGVRRDCDEMRMAYVHSQSPEERRAIMSTLRHRVSGAPANVVPQDCRDFANGEMQ